MFQFPMFLFPSALSVHRLRAWGELGQFQNSAADFCGKYLMKTTKKVSNKQTEKGERLTVLYFKGICIYLEKYES